MKWIFKLVDWIKKETWWRKYYKKYTLSNTDAWHGRCTFCDASIDKNDTPRCNIIKGKYCPCKWNECLVRK